VDGVAAHAIRFANVFEKDVAHKMSLFCGLQIFQVTISKILGPNHLTFFAFAPVGCLVYSAFSGSRGRISNRLRATFPASVGDGVPNLLRECPRWLALCFCGTLC